MVKHNPKVLFWVTLLNNVNFLAPVATLFYLHRGMDFSQIFSFLVIIVTTMLLMEVPTGMVSDRFGRKTSIVLGQFTFVLSAIVLYFSHSYLSFAIVFILGGIGLTFFSGTDEALVFDSLKQVGDDSDMKKSMGGVWSGAFIPTIIIAPIASYIAQDLTSQQFSILLLGNIVIHSFNLLLTFALKEPERSTGVREESSLYLFKTAFSHIKKSPKLWKLFINKTLILIVGAHVLMEVWQPYLKNAGVDVLWFGWIMAGIAIISYFLYQNLNRIERFISDKDLLFYTSLIPLICFIAAPFVNYPLLAVLIYFIIKICIDLRNPVFSQYFNLHINSDNRATVLSSLSVVDSAFDIVVLLSAGFIADLSISYVFLFSAAVILLTTLFFPIKEEYLDVKQN